MEWPMPAAPRNSGAIPSLDGIRAIAVSLVFAAHSGLENVIPGGLGVTIFFVLSGYLITTLMRIEHGASGTVSFKAFYLRRVLRLMPPLVVVVAIAAVLARLGIANGEFTPAGLASVLLYFGNYFVIANDFHGVPEGIGVTWSLAVEEHYYLFYPPLALLLLRFARVRVSVALLVTMCVAVLAWRCWLASHGGSEAWITMATDTRIDAILAGCILALVANPWLDPPRRRNPVRAHAILAGCIRALVANPWLDPPRSRNPVRDQAILGGCIAVLLATLAIRNEFFRETFRYTLQSLAIAPLIWLAVANHDRPTFRWLDSAPMAYVGKVSYTIYLCHHLILCALQKQLPDLPWLAIA